MNYMPQVSVNSSPCDPRFLLNKNVRHRFIPTGVLEWKRTPVHLFIVFVSVTETLCSYYKQWKKCCFNDWGYCWLNRWHALAERFVENVWSTQFVTLKGLCWLFCSSNKFVGTDIAICVLLLCGKYAGVKLNRVGIKDKELFISWFSKGQLLSLLTYLKYSWPKTQSQCLYECIWQTQAVIHSTNMPKMNKHNWE